MEKFFQNPKIFLVVLVLVWITHFIQRGKPESSYNRGCFRFFPWVLTIIFFLSFPLGYWGCEHNSGCSKRIAYKSLKSGLNKLQEKDYIQAATLIDSALVCFSELKDTVGMVNCHVGLGMANAFKDYQVVLDNGLKALEFINASEDTSLLKQKPGLLIMIAGINLNLGHYNKSFSKSHQTLDLEGNNAYSIYKVSAFNIIGKNYYSFGIYDSALIFQNLALDEMEKIPTKTSFFDYFSDEGRNKLMSSMALTNLKPSILQDIGNIHRNLGNYEKAIEYYNQALSEAKDEEIVKYLHSNLGIAYLELQMLDKAEENIKQGGNPIALSKFYLEANDYSQAINHLKEGLDLKPQNQNPEFLFFISTGLGQAFEGLKDSIQAINNYRKATEILENLKLNMPDGITDSLIYNSKVWGFSKSEPFKSLDRLISESNHSLKYQYDSKEVESGE